MHAVPENSEDLYELLNAANDLCGHIRLVTDISSGYGGCSIVWELHGNLLLDIVVDAREAYVGVNNNLTHWHLEPEEIVDFLCLLGKKGNIVVIKTSFFCISLFYCGPANEYKLSKRTKWHGLGRLHYFGE